MLKIPTPWKPPDLFLHRCIPYERFAVVPKDLMELVGRRQIEQAVSYTAL